MSLNQVFSVYTLVCEKYMRIYGLKDIPIVMARAGEQRNPADLLLTRLPVPPNCIRPSVVSEVGLLRSVEFVKVLQCFQFQQIIVEGVHHSFVQVLIFS